MAPSSFLFVNKDSRSDSLSNSRTNRVARIEIHQHAGKNASRKKRRRRTASATSLDGTPTIFAPRGPPEALTTATERLSPLKEEGDLLQCTSAIPPASKENPSKKLPCIFPVRQGILQRRHLPGPHVSGTPPPDSLAKLSPQGGQRLLTSPRPQSPISAVPNYLTTLTPREHQILHRYTSTWMPAFAGQGTTTGFTVLSSKDMAFSSFIIRSAMQTADPFSLYAFLTMAAQRMHLTNHLPDQDSSPEYFSVRSVQALRDMACRPFSEELVLALANLVLGEAYIKRTRSLKSPAVSFYRVMQRDLIIRAGGLNVLSPSTAQIAVAYDFYTSQGTLTLPYFDIYQSPELLGINASTLPESQGDRHDYVLERLQSLDPALRVLLESCHDLSEVITAIGRLDSYAIKALATEVWINVPKKLALNAATLQRLSQSEVSVSADVSYLGAVDALWMHIRQQAYLIWVWQTALGLSIFTSSPRKSELTTVSPGRVSCAEPASVTRAVSQLWSLLDQVQSQLEHTGWKVRTKVVLWICALCSLTAANETEQQAYLRRFEISAAALEIDTEAELRVMLNTMLPLELSCPDRDAVSWLWSELMRFRNGSASQGNVVDMRHGFVRKEELLGRTIILECSRGEVLTP